MLSTSKAPSIDKVPNVPPIDKIPNEVIMHIFYIHVWNNDDAPHRLQRVCRRWHQVADNMGSIWGNIALYDTSDPTYYFGVTSLAKWKSELKNRVHCHSFNSLAAAIERTRNSNFELTILITSSHSSLITEDFRFLEPPSISKRCRALQVINGIVPRFLNHISDLSALQILDLHTNYDSNKAIISPLLKTVQKTSKNLWSFRIGAGMSYDHTVKELVSRVTTLYVGEYWDQLSEIASDATSVKILDLGTPGYGHLTIPIPFTSPNLDTIILRNLCWSSLAQETASRIRYLELHTQHRGQDISSPLEFPNLMHLAVHDWWAAITEIQAPNLEVLNLKEFSVRNQVTGCIKKATMRPKKLEMEMTMPENVGRRIIQSIAQNVEDLQVVYKGVDRSLTSYLAYSLAGKGRKQPPCPKLQRLVVLSQKSSAKRQEMSEKQLQDIADGLANTTILKEVRYGWYDSEVGCDTQDTHTAWTQIL